MMNETPDIDQYWHALEAALPTFAEDEQRAAITLYRELAKGSPVSTRQFAAALDVPVESAEDLLGRDSIRCLVYPDEEGNVLGFGGLAAKPMPHKLDLDGRTLWTWCAWDSLFIPEILGEQAQVESSDPHTGGTIRLTVTPNGVRSQEPETTVLSFVALDAELFNSSAENVMGSFCHFVFFFESREPQDAVVSFIRADSTQFDGSADNVMGSFCHFVFFFESRESGERWAANHEGTFLLGLDEAAELARRLNARTWGDALTRTDGRAAVGSRT